MLITVLMPDQTRPQLQVADDELVFDGSDFAPPQTVKYIELYALPVQAASLPFDDIARQMLATSVKIHALVVDRTAGTVTQTSPQVVASLDPSNGECLCFVTCNGTKLSFVKVHTET